MARPLRTLLLELLPSKSLCCIIGLWSNKPNKTVQQDISSLSNKVSKSAKMHLHCKVRSNRYEQGNKNVLIS